MRYNYKYVEPYFENTSQLAFYKNGEIYSYEIRPIGEYVLHDKGRDVYLYDDNTGLRTDEVLYGYTDNTLSISADYDFEKNIREIYAILKTNINNTEDFCI